MVFHVVSVGMPSRYQRMNIRQLLQYIPAEPDMANSRYVHFKELANKGRPDFPIIHGMTVTAIPNDQPRAHRQIIKPAPPFYRGKLVACPAVQVTCDCLSGENRVLTDQGWKSIHSLVDPAKNPVTDFPVKYVVNGKPYSGSVPFWKGKKKTWLIELENGYRLTVTKNHKILTYAGIKQVRKSGKYYTKPVRRWVKVKNLKPGSKIYINLSSELAQVRKNDHYWASYFHGVFHGDGTFNPFSIEVHSHPKILKLLDKIGIEAKLQDGKGRYLLARRAREVLAKFDVTNPVMRHHLAVEIADPFALLSGLLDSDGTIHADGRGVITGCYNLRKMSDKLIALGVHGVKFGLYREKGTETNFGVATKDSYVLTVSAQGMRQMAANLCSVKYKEYEGKASIQVRENVSKVNAISYAGRRDVYDIHVPEIHRFVAESAIVHNCERFLYMWEYALWWHGAAKIINGNGQPPIETNPKLVPGSCKHLLIIYKMLQRNKL